MVYSQNKGIRAFTRKIEDLKLLLFQYINPDTFDIMNIEELVYPHQEGGTKMSSKAKKLELDKRYEEERKNRVYLTKEEVDALTPEEIAEAKIRGAMLGFFESLIDGKTQEAYMCLGALRNAEVPDLPYYYATIKQYEKDYAGALAEYKKIEKDSEKYAFAAENIERIYILTGDYEELSKLSADKEQSDAAKFYNRLLCLMHAKDRPVDELEKLINQFPFEVISGMKPDDEDEEETHIKICKMICNCLVAAGTCISNVGSYTERMKDKQIDYDNDQNIQTYIDTLRIYRNESACMYMIRSQRRIWQI